VSSDRIDALIAEIERHPDAALRDQVRELLGLVLDLHGEAFTRMLEVIAAADGDASVALAAIVVDPVLQPVLDLHDLTPGSRTAPAAVAVTLGATRRRP
jgi:hypothetical protein